MRGFFHPNERIPLEPKPDMRDIRRLHERITALEWQIKELREAFNAHAGDKIQRGANTDVDTLRREG